MKLYPGNALVEYIRKDGYERDALKTGDEVIISCNYGRQRVRATILRTTPTQFFLDNQSRYSIKTGRKIGSANSYDAPHILGVAKHTREEADRINAAVVAAAREAAQKAALADILDQVEKLADERGVGIGQVLEEVNDLNVQRLGEAIRAHEEAKRAGQ